jgi:NADP-dependent 3-hydroxy acid dehydrogenase YdfG
MIMYLKGKTAFVTGPTSGIGLATFRRKNTFLGFGQ